MYGPPRPVTGIALLSPLLSIVGEIRLENGNTKRSQLLTQNTEILFIDSVCLLKDLENVVEIPVRQAG
jgi:hypothetical protein